MSNSMVPMLAGVGLLMVCCSCSSSLGMMMNTKKEDDDDSGGGGGGGGGDGDAMAMCLDTRKRAEKNWTQHPRAAHTEAQARALCTGKKYMSLECPTADGYEVWCADDITEMPVLADAECKGTTSDTSINNGENGGCDAGGGSYLTTEGLNMGGNHRGAVYEI